MKPDVCVLIGPTASGKSAAALEVAERIGGEIVSADSMKVYRGMDIGTAKPSAEERARVPHHLIDIRDPWENFSVKDFVEEAERCIRDIAARDKVPVVEGGTALYLKCLTEGLFEGAGRSDEIRAKLEREAELEREGRRIAASGGPVPPCAADSRDPGAQESAVRNPPRTLHERLRAVDPEAAGRIHPKDYRRIVRALEVYEVMKVPISKLQKQFGRERGDMSFKWVGVKLPREVLHRRINARTKAMFERGLVEEVRAIVAKGGFGITASQALGYSEVLGLLDGQYDTKYAVYLVKRNTRRFARKQMTWFRKFRHTKWIETDGSDTERVVEEVVRAFGFAQDKQGYTG